MTKQLDIGMFVLENGQIVMGVIEGVTNYTKPNGDSVRTYRIEQDYEIHHETQSDGSSKYKIRSWLPMVIVPHEIPSSRIMFYYGCDAISSDLFDTYVVRAVGNRRLKYPKRAIWANLGEKAIYEEMGA